MSKTQANIMQYVTDEAIKNNISIENVLEVIKKCFQEILSRKYKNHMDLFQIDVTSKNVILKKRMKVSEKPTDLFREISLSNALKRDREAVIGGILEIILDLNEEFNNSEIVSLGRMFSSQLRQKKKEIEFDQFQKKLNTVVYGTIKYVDNIDNNIRVDVDGTECLMYADKCLPADKLKLNKKLCFFVYKVAQNFDGFQIFLSRNSSQLLEHVVKTEIADFDKKIEIVSSARIPGVKSVVAVRAKDPLINAAAYCIGKARRMEAVPVNVISEKLDSRERIIFVNWKNDLAAFLQECMKPVNILSVLINDVDTINLVVPDRESEEFENDRQTEERPAIERAWVENALLTGRLLKKKVFLITESDFKKLYSKGKYAADLMKELGVTEEIANLLIENNIYSTHKLSLMTKEDLQSKVEEFDDEDGEFIENLLTRAEEAKKEQIEKYHLKYTGDQRLFCFHSLSAAESYFLVSQDISNLLKLASSSPERVFNILKPYKTMEEVQDLITAAGNTF